MNLYELSEQAAALQAMLTAEEIDEQTLHDTLEAMEAGQKLESCCKMIRNLEAEAKMYKDEKDRLADKQRKAESAVARLRQNIQNYLTQSGQRKASAGLFSVSLAKSESVQILNEEEIPWEFKIPQPAELDKKGIRDAIKSGELIPGAAIIEKESVRIR